MKTTLNEFEEKTNKKLEEINKFLKESQEKAIKQVKETVQDLKIEIEHGECSEECLSSVTDKSSEKVSKGLKIFLYGKYTND
ncbi:hypothetical protein STEG23_030827 [Scotinomys teguina]